MTLVLTGKHMQPVTRDHKQALLCFRGDNQLPDINGVVKIIEIGVPTISIILPTPFISLIKQQSPK